MHLDTVCTMVDVDAVVMYPNIADTLAGLHRHRRRRRCTSSGPEPFLVAAAKAMGIDTLRVIDTGLDPITAEREQWDDGNNTLAIGPRLAVAYERNVETNARLEEAGIEVVADRRQRARQRPRRAAVHVLPDQPGAAARPERAASVTARQRRIPSSDADLAADMEGPERNRRGMQQRSGLDTTISETPAGASRNAAVYAGIWCRGHHVPAAVRRSAQGELPAAQAGPGPPRRVVQRACCRPAPRASRPAKASTGSSSASAPVPAARSQTGTTRPCARNDPT